MNNVATLLVDQVSFAKALPDKPQRDETPDLSPGEPTRRPFAEELTEELEPTEELTEPLEQASQEPLEPALADVVLAPLADEALDQPNAATMGLITTGAFSSATPSENDAATPDHVASRPSVHLHSPTGSVANSPSATARNHEAKIQPQPMPPGDAPRPTPTMPTRGSAHPPNHSPQVGDATDTRATASRTEVGGHPIADTLTVLRARSVVAPSLDVAAVDQAQRPATFDAREFVQAVGNQPLDGSATLSAASPVELLTAASATALASVLATGQQVTEMSPGLRAASPGLRAASPGLRAASPGLRAETAPIPRDQDRGVVRRSNSSFESRSGGEVPVAVIHAASDRPAAPVTSIESIAPSVEVEREPLPAPAKYAVALDSPEFGALKVEVNQSHEGVQARFIAASDMAYRLVSEEIHNIRHVVEQSGVAAGDFTFERQGSDAADPNSNHHPHQQSGDESPTTSDTQAFSPFGGDDTDQPGINILA